MQRARLVVAYHGARFRGAAPNHGVRTVAGDLAPAIAAIVRTPVELTLAGRTDAGVHAWGQVISLDLPGGTDLDRLVHRLNRWLAPDIAVRESAWATPDFDARFSATSRSYRYDVWNEPVPNPLAADVTWHVPHALDLDAMNTAAGAFVGEHDFTSFCRRPKTPDGMEPASLVRIVHHARWERVDGPLLRFAVRASAFCHQMVRSIVGTTVDVGLGRVAADAIPAILTARDRGRAGQVAPPHGLTLWSVGYDGTRWDEG